MNAIQDAFEDAPDITPRPRAKSIVSSRSLTERRKSSTTTIDGVRSGDGAAEDAPVESVVTVVEPKANGHASNEEQEKRLSVSELSDVNLDGKCRSMLHPAATATPATV